MKPMIPWEESQFHQEANYRVIRFCLVCATIIGVMLGLLSGVWSVLIGLAVFFVALAIYAAIIWTGAHIVLVLIRFFRRWRQRTLR